MVVAWFLYGLIGGVFATIAWYERMLARKQEAQLLAVMQFSQTQVDFDANIEWLRESGFIG